MRRSSALRSDSLLVRELEAWRLALGIEHQAFARVLGMSPSWWSRVRCGERRVSLRAGQRLVARRPQLQPFWFADLSASPSPNKTLSRIAEEAKAS